MTHDTIKAAEAAALEEAAEAIIRTKLDDAALDIIESLVEAEKRGDAYYSRNPYDGQEAVVIDYDWWKELVADAEKLVKENGDG